VAREVAEAVKWWRKAAEQGHANAQYGLGAMYTSGRGVARDDAEAAKWFRKAAENPETEVPFCNIGNLISYSENVEYRKEAIGYWLQGINHGDACSHVSLGWAYMSKEFMAPDYARAAELNQKGGELGDAEGFNNLGWLYEHGLGVRQSKTTALYYYKKAIEGCWEKSRCDQATSRHARLAAELGVSAQP
jgi:TPR repeat protein